MIYDNAELIAKFNEPSRRITGGIYIFTGEEITGELLSNDTLVKFEIENTSPKNKFFGYVITKKLTVELLGKSDLTKETRLWPYIGAVGLDLVPELPYFYIDNIEYNEVSNKTIITAYDIIYQATRHTASELALTDEYIYTYDFATMLANSFGAELFDGKTGNTESWQPITFTPEKGGVFEIGVNKSNVNLAGTETIKDVLGYFAEAIGCICHVHWKNGIFFAPYCGYSSSQLTLTPSDYFDFTYNEPVKLTKITHATELGDNVFTGTDDGFHQVMWDNPFLSLRTGTNLASHFNKYNIMLRVIEDTPIVPFTLKFRGTPNLEFGEWLIINTPKGEVVNAPLYNLKLTYDGGLSAEANWDVPEEENVNTNNSMSLGVNLKNTFAKVDKISNEVVLSSQKVDEFADTVGELVVRADNIESSITSLDEKVSATMTKDNIKILIEQTMRDVEVEAVRTRTGFTFNQDGLLIERSDSDISTIITEDGMTVMRSGEAVLTADSRGVEATDLHARTYLLIGNNSRFEDYQTNRTGCFWIGELIGG